MFDSVFLFFRAHRTKDLTRKREKVGPFECDRLEKHPRVGAGSYPLTVHALLAMTKFENPTPAKKIQKCRLAESPLPALMPGMTLD